MKSKQTNRTFKFVKNVLNVPKWMDYGRMKTTSTSMYDNLKTMFVPQESSGQTEELKQAMARLGLSQEDLMARKKAFYRLSWLMVILAFLVFLYTCYHIYHFNGKAIIMSSVVTALALGFAFRYHFWYFQIKKGKLGCTFKEWFKQGFLGSNDET